MKKINLRHWKPFKVGNLFAATNTGNILARDVEDGSGDTPYVTASGINNGVVAHIDASKYDVIKGNCILVGGKTFTLTYQKKDFVSNDSHNFELHLKEGVPNEKIYLYFIVVLKATFSQKYTWGDAVTKDKILNATISLPATSDKEPKPDFAYMEQYMTALEQRVKVTIDLLAETNGGGYKIDASRWKKFHLYDDNLFEIDSGTKLDRVKMTNYNSSVNFVGRANAKNGVTDFIDAIPGLEPYGAGLMTISLGGEYLGSCFVQDRPFYTSQNVNVLIPKRPMSDACKRFIGTVVFREGQLRYKAFSDELNRHIRRDFAILLPSLPDGTPDFAYMESYMKDIHDRVTSVLGAHQVAV